MGSHLYVYVGPFIACKAEKVKTATPVRSCPNPNCSKPKPKSSWEKVSAQFCDACGTEIESVAVEVERYPSPYAALGDDESLALLESGSPEDESTAFFGANFKLSDRSCNIDDEEYHFDIRSIEIEAEIAHFEKKCATGLAACRAFYKDTLVSWGVHLYRR